MNTVCQGAGETEKERWWVEGGEPEQHLWHFWAALLRHLQRAQEQRQVCQVLRVQLRREALPQHSWSAFFPISFPKNLSHHLQNVYNLFLFRSKRFTDHLAVFFTSISAEWPGCIYAVCSPRRELPSQIPQVPPSHPFSASVTPNPTPPQHREQPCESGRSGRPLWVDCQLKQRPPWASLCCTDTGWPMHSISWSLKHLNTS